MVENYIRPMTIMELFLEAEGRLGARVAKHWWEQSGLWLAGKREDEELEGSEELEGTED